MVATALLALALVQTDQTVNVQKGTRLDVNDFAGEVVVKTWDKDAVRVQAEHSDRETIEIRPGDQTLTVRSGSRRGAPRSLDYTITVPAWMGINVSGTYVDVTMDGVGGDVTVETTRGDIDVKGGSGTITLKSVEGEISLERAKGHIDVRAVNEGIKLADITGDLSAETVNGSIILDRVDSSNVDLYTVNGNISYDGPIHDKGTYRISTHNGTIGMTVADRTNASILVRTYNGSFQSTFAVKTESGDQEHRKRFTIVIGNGSAHVELETFGGRVLLRRPGEPRPELETRRRHRDRGNQ